MLFFLSFVVCAATAAWCAHVKIFVLPVFFFFCVARSHPRCRSAPPPLPHQPRANQVQRVGYGGAGEVRRASGRILVSGHIIYMYVWYLPNISLGKPIHHHRHHDHHAGSFEERTGCLYHQVAFAFESERRIILHPVLLFRYLFCLSEYRQH